MKFWATRRRGFPLRDNAARRRSDDHRPRCRRMAMGSRVIRDLGTAVFIAAMLGLTIDRWLKTQIARDVFQAALGYFLPQEFREEVANVARFKFLCERHVAKLHIKDIGDGSVQLTNSIERTLKISRMGRRKREHSSRSTSGGSANHRKYTNVSSNFMVALIQAEAQPKLFRRSPQQVNMSKCHPVARSLPQQNTAR